MLVEKSSFIIISSWLLWEKSFLCVTLTHFGNSLLFPEASSKVWPVWDIQDSGYKMFSKVLIIAVKVVRWWRKSRGFFFPVKVLRAVIVWALIGWQGHTSPKPFFDLWEILRVQKHCNTNNMNSGWTHSGIEMFCWCSCLQKLHFDCWLCAKPGQKPAVIRRGKKTYQVNCRNKSLAFVSAVQRKLHLTKAHRQWISFVKKETLLFSVVFKFGKSWNAKQSNRTKTLKMLGEFRYWNG